MNVVYVTGNPHKAKYFNKMVGLSLQHKKFDVDEIQSLDSVEIIKHKAKQAYKLAKCPVIIEDTKLTFNALGRLPGPFIKWFQQESGEEGLCRLLDGYNDRSTIAGAAMAYYDGMKLEVFESELRGKIVQNPIGDNGFGWNVIFKPEGANVTLGQMSEKEFKKWYAKVKPFAELKAFLDKQITK